MAICQYGALGVGSSLTSFYIFREPHIRFRIQQGSPVRTTLDRTFESGDPLQWQWPHGSFNNLRFHGVEESTGHAIFQRLGLEQYYIVFVGNTDPAPGSDTYTVSNPIDTEGAARFGNAPLYADYGLRRETGDTNEYTSQNREVEVDPGIYDVGDEVELRILTRDADGNVDGIQHRFTAKFQGLDQFTGDPIFDAPENPPEGFSAGRDIVLSDTAGGPGVTYNIARDHIITDAPLRAGDVTFMNYAVKSGTAIGDGLFQLQGASVRFGHGCYPDNDTLTINVDGTDTQVTLFGYESVTNYPIFLDTSGTGERLIVAINLDAQADTYVVDTSNVVTDMPYITCFAPGTLIATPDGERAVETLSPGDMVLTADGDTVPVRFVGFQKVPTLFGPRELTHPVRIRAGALGRNTPHTDLVVTRDHGMIVDGVICHAGALINGTSIIEVPTRDLARVATYYHVETEGHVPLLANGAVAESFIDEVDRATFANHGEFVAMYGARVPAMTQMNLPRAMSARQVPPRIRTRLGLPEHDATVIIPAPAPSGVRGLWAACFRGLRSAGRRLGIA